MSTQYHAEDGFWTAWGRPKVSMTAPPIVEWPPPLFSYRPGPSTTGPRPDRTLTRYDGDFYVTSPGQIVENLDVYGRIILRTTATDATIRNCIVRGPGSAYLGTQTSCIYPPSDFDFRGLTIEDCRLDATGRENMRVDGMRGGNYTMRRTEISGVQDGISLNTYVGNQTIEACWVHNGYYEEWVDGQPDTTQSSTDDNKTHNDCVQFHQGKNISIRGCYLGGPREDVPSRGDVNVIDPTRVAIVNANDDFDTSACMIQQEVSSELLRKVENVLIEGNWLQGGTATVNIIYKNGNDLSTVSLINNRFMLTNDPTQIAIIKDVAVNAVITGNVYDHDGSPVPITRGR